MGMIAETFSSIALGQGLAPQSPAKAVPAPVQARLAPRPFPAGLAAPMQGGPLALGALQGLVGYLRGPRT